MFVHGDDFNLLNKMHLSSPVGDTAEHEMYGTMIGKQCTTSKRASLLSPNLGRKRMIRQFNTCVDNQVTLLLFLRASGRCG